MGWLFSGTGSLVMGGGAVLATLDIDGFLVGNEMLTLMAGLFSAFFAGLANALISGIFAAN